MQDTKELLPPNLFRHHVFVYKAGMVLPFKFLSFILRDTQKPIGTCQSARGIIAAELNAILVGFSCFISIEVTLTQ